MSKIKINIYMTKILYIVNIAKNYIYPKKIYIYKKIIYIFNISLK